MGYLKKTAYFIKREGLLPTAKRALGRVALGAAHLPNRLRERAGLSGCLRQIGEMAAGREVFLLLPCFEWNYPLFQRPHQIAAALARRENVCVLFVSDEYRYDDFAGAMSISPELCVVSRRIVPRMAPALAGAKKVTAVKYWPMQAELLEAVPFDELVYVCMDDLSLLSYCDEELTETHRRLMGRADLTVCTSRKLYEDAVPYAKRAILSPNAADCTLFRQARSLAPPAELREKTKGFRCVLGYFGSLGRWLDFELILQAAEARPDWCFLFIGETGETAANPLRRAGKANVLVYPAQEHARLPFFAAAFDIQLIPFRVDEMTAAVSPVKLFEYMAVGKPILSAALPECSAIPCVAVYRDLEGFLSGAEALLGKKNDGAFLAELDREASKHTWEARVGDVLAALKTVNEESRQKEKETRA